MNEDPNLAPVCKKIFKLLRRREDIRKQLGALSLAHDNEQIDLRSRVLRSTELALLRTLISLPHAVELALCRREESTQPVKLARSCKLFSIATALVNSATASDPGDVESCTIHSVGEGRTRGPIVDKFFTTRYGGKLVSHMGLAGDLLQYWELLLRLQTEIPCEDFCNGVRDSLCPRVRTLLRYDTFLKRDPATKKPPAASRSVEALAKDVIDRLSRVTLRLEQIELLRRQFCGQLEADFLEMPRERSLYLEELATVLSELVHLADNTRKLLKASHQNPKDIQFVEELTCYRVAACFVNTRKHGIRGRNKTIAVADLELVLTNEHIHGIDYLINYKGNGWLATRLIDDLLNVWEIFLRYYTNLSFEEFREHVGSRFKAHVGLQSYFFKFGSEFYECLSSKAAERLRYDI